MQGFLVNHRAIDWHAFDGLGVQIPHQVSPATLADAITYIQDARDKIPHSRLAFRLAEISQPILFRLQGNPDPTERFLFIRWPHQLTYRTAFIQCLMLSIATRNWQQTGSCEELPPGRLYQHNKHINHVFVSKDNDPNISIYLPSKSLSSATFYYKDYSRRYPQKKPMKLSDILKRKKIPVIAFQSGATSSEGLTTAEVSATFQLNRFLPMSASLGWAPSLCNISKDQIPVIAKIMCQFHPSLTEDSTTRVLQIAHILSQTLAGD